jgi:hypothetical protein
VNLLRKLLAFDCIAREPNNKLLNADSGKTRIFITGIT